MRTVIVALVLFFSVDAAAQCDRVGSTFRIEWDAVLDPDVAGYNVYRTTVPTPDDSDWVLEGAVTETQWEPTIADGEHRFRVTAFDDVANESPPSNVVCADVDTTAPGAPTIRIEITVSVVINGETVEGVKVATQDPGILTMAVGDTIDVMTPLGSADSAPTAREVADAVLAEQVADHSATDGKR